MFTGLLGCSWSTCLKLTRSPENRLIEHLSIALSSWMPASCTGWFSARAQMDTQSHTTLQKSHSSFSYWLPPGPCTLTFPLSCVEHSLRLRVTHPSLALLWRALRNRGTGVGPVVVDRSNRKVCKETPVKNERAMR